jgi:TolB protein
MKNRRVVLSILFLLVAVVAIVLSIVNDRLRNAPITLGSGDSDVTVEGATAEVNQSAEIPFAPPPSTLAFIGDSAGSWDIFILSPDGTLKNLSGDDSQYADYFPSFALDGQQINFIANRGTDVMGPTQVLVDGTDLKSLSVVEAIFSLASAGRFDWDPSWSPNGKNLLWSSLRDLNLELYVIPTDAEFVVSNATRLTSSGARDWFGAWSPDGTQIAFSSDREGNEDIYVINASGGEATRLTTSEFDDIRAVWSLDGTQILYVYDDNDSRLASGNLDLYIMNADGSDAKPFEGVFIGDPIYSKDGTQMAYMSNMSGKWQIYVMNADGTNIRRITPDDGNYLFPVWKP